MMYNKMSLGGEDRQARICCLLVPTSPPTRESVRQQIRAFLHSVMKKREIVIIGECAFVPLSQGYVATVDASDVHLLGDNCWTAIVRKHTVYAYQRRNGQTVQMHRLIMGQPDGFTVDHKDGNGLNNTRSNLRVATSSQNNRNQRLTERNTSGHKGVSWHNRDRRWRAQIHLNDRYVHLGNFKSFEDACAAYSEASASMHGEFGRLR